MREMFPPAATPAKPELWRRSMTFAWFQKYIRLSGESADGHRPPLHWLFPAQPCPLDALRGTSYQLMPEPETTNLDLPPQPHLQSGHVGNPGEASFRAVFVLIIQRAAFAGQLRRATH
jgi:hypothetical protein